MKSKPTSATTFQFSDRVVIITGAAHGIGKIMAFAFAKSGAQVVIADIRVKEAEKVAAQIRDANGRASFVRTDLRKEADIKKLIATAKSRFKRIDILINNARPQLKHLPFVQSFKEWDLGMDVFLKASALTARYAIPEMMKNGGGNIVNMTSINATLICHQPAVYHVAKAGIIQLTRFLAYEYGHQGIRVNAVSPGLVDLKDDDRPALTSNHINKKVTEQVVPLKRAASGEDIAHSVLFLCSDAASYINGEVLTIDGGMTLGDQFGLMRRSGTRS